ncbi:protein SEMI-ROLLED LEAF 2-like isoform X2 [Phragmites australis]|uniref:protein SEMI-ROLLED LEAF 2-like isoform X2 n=1 Tax=Phragmites australis TaxID=29695 RepID=UPI002D78328C|nr:protein SEMI-ROLLED LEAF 2-like isoform X2 [Phragmites australis]
MGFIPAKLLPSCESMCVCCPALRPSSRRPVKRYKKLLAEIFPKTPDGAPNERKIMKLCEYAAKNPLRIPKIAKFLEQRSHKELRAAHVNFVRIITEAYSKLLFICKEQMTYFAISLVNVLTELLESKQENIQILGCQTLARFINSQIDNTYAHNIESLVRKVCVLSRQQGEEHSLLRAASLQCLSAMIWFMKEHSYMFADFDEIVQSVLENYRREESATAGGERHASQHNWVDEIARCESRPGLGGGNDVNFSSTTIRLRPTRDSSALTREECESPEVWSHICVQKLAELAKESITMRRILDPMLSYFDMKKQWAPRHGLALLVLSDMAYLEKSSGNEQLILTAVIRHLDHKNVLHDPQTKSNIIQTATSLARQLRSRGVAAELIVASDLCKHLRKTLEAVESACVEELNLNESLQTFLEDCLLEIVRGINDVRPLYDMMAITLENLPSIPTVARATIGSLLILSHMISLTSMSSKTPMVFPEALLQQILKSMVHPDVDTRVGAHHMFSAVIVRGPSHPRNESEYLYETKKWQSRTTSVFASATALLEKLMKEKESSDKPRNVMHDDVKERNMHEENKHVWARRNSAYFSKLVFSFTDRCAPLNSSAEGTNISMLTEDQTNQLLSAFWIQANQTDNTPFNYEAIDHSYSLTVLSSRLENSSHSNIIQFFQLPLSLRSIALTPNGVLPASCQRSIFILATSMLAFAGKVFHITELADLLRCFTSSNIDPYLRIGEDLQLYVRLQSDLGNYGSESDQEGAKSILSDCRTKVGINDQRVLDVTASALSSFTEMGKDVLAKELTEMFTPEEVPLFGSSSALDWANFHLQAFSDESLSFDEECSRTSSVDCGLHESPITNTASFISKITLPQSVPHVLGVGQLLESALHVAGQVAGASVSTSPLPYGTMTSQCEALGLGTRKKLSSWLVNGHESTQDNPMPSLPIAHHSIIPKVNSCGFESIHRTSSEPCSTVKLPPASPFDNFLKAAYRTQPEL